MEMTVHMGIPLGAGRFGEGSGIARLSTELGFCGFLGCTFRRAAGEQNGFKERSRKRGLATSASGNFDRRRPVEVSRRDSSRNAPSGERRQQRTKFRDDISPHRAGRVLPPSHSSLFLSDSSAFSLFLFGAQAQPAAEKVPFCSWVVVVCKHSLRLK
ncbi:hypothetical protein AXG93_1520s1400 [Marchantia polymorpha subsp. ruderalis]|uniref:Uncharacterized protein n=1 Tax=Marchantia polymorpha subsp. ruderalis TaxID=1480154 RepID=A0A176VJM1_MARPO|nr:hypothetical protein AXG93_1520s1400 [Marchantia polymorpha subsp. ruderalis]